jgi:signal transduction histidine kinase
MKLRIKTRLRLLKRRLQQVLARKISTQLMLTYIGLAVIPLVFVSIFLISLSQSTVQNYVFQLNHETARRASNEIYLFLRDPLTVLQTAALSRDMYEMDVFHQGNLINRIKEAHPIFSKIYVVNDSGIVVVTTHFGEESKDMRNEPFFQHEGEYFSEVYFSPSRFPLMTIAEPIYRFHQPIGRLVAEIDLKNIWALVDSVTIGKTGFAFLLSADGQVIAHPDKEKVYNRVNYAEFDFFQQLKSGVVRQITHESDGKIVLLVHAEVPKLGWSVLVEQSEEEAFQLASQMQRNVMYFTSLAALMAILLGILSIRRFTRPLLELVRGAREFSSGNLNHRIDLPTDDELGELALEFNAMANSLLENQRELQRMERLAALSRFAALVSHEVRNPLNSMNINMQMLKRTISRPDIPEEKKIKYLDVISSEINRINDLVTNFLTIARPPELNPVRTDIHAVLSEVVLLQQVRAEAEGIRVETNFAPQNITGLFDYNQLKQVFHNIFINAIEAIADTGEILITTRVLEKEESGEKKYYVVVEFKDNGEGIPREILEEVFEFYHTTKRSGTGLGLAIARQIIHGHKGEIYIRSRVGEGTTVFIELPIDPPNSFSDSNSDNNPIKSLDSM